MAGVARTGSLPVGIIIFRGNALSNFVHPVMPKLGGKNPAIASRSDNLDDAALGFIHSEFGVLAQKCSARSWCT